MKIKFPVIFAGSCFLFSMQSFSPVVLGEYKLSGFAQGTTYHITYYAADSFVTKKNIDSILDKIDSSLSVYKTYSLISAFNRDNYGIEMDEHLKKIVDASLPIYKETGGISDITVYSLVNAWGFGPDHITTAPDSAGIASLLPCVGSDKIHMIKNRLVKDRPCVKIDVNGIAQGYSVDVVAEFLEKKGIHDYLVEIGGELRINGRKQPGGERMKIGIEAPAKNSRDEPVIRKIIEIEHGAVTTSGNYRKYFIKNGKTMSHLINPKTGYPFQNELISVSVWSNEAIIADGYDNALMGMGLKDAMTFLEKHNFMQAYFIYHKPDGSIGDTATRGFYALFVKPTIKQAD